MIDTEKIVRHPVSWAIGAVAAVTALQPAFVAGLFTATWVNLPQLFTLVSIGALTLPPHIPPQSSADWLVVVVGVAFAARTGWMIWQTYDREI